MGGVVAIVATVFESAGVSAAVATGISTGIVAGAAVSGTLTAVEGGSFSDVLSSMATGAIIGGVTGGIVSEFSAASGTTSSTTAISSEGASGNLTSNYFNSQLGNLSAAGTTTTVGLGPTVTAANAMTGAPTILNANILNAYSIGATSFTTNAAGVAAFNGVTDFGVLTPYSVQGQMLGFSDELTANTLHFLGMPLTGNTLNIINDMSKVFNLMGGMNSSLQPSNAILNNTTDLGQVLTTSRPNIHNNPIMFGYQRQLAKRLSNIKMPINYGSNKMNGLFTDYRGGLSEVLAPQLINQNEGSIFNNIDINSGILKSINIGNKVSTNTFKYKKFLEDTTYYFASDYMFSLTKIGNFYYVTTEHPSYNYVYRLVLNQPILTEADLLPVDLVAPTTKPIITAVITQDTYTVYASLVNIRNSSGVEETYTATIDANYNTSIHNALVNNTALTLSGTCSAGTPDGRTIIVSVAGIDFNSVSSAEKFSVTIPDLSFLSQQLNRELWDTYQYAYTYYNSNTGFESVPIFSDTYLRKATSLKISNIMNIQDVNVDKIRIYRIGGYTSVYRRIAELTNLNDNSLSSYTDNITETMTLSILDTDNISSITGLTGLLEHKGSLFAFKDNQVYFSIPGKPNVWSEFNMIKVGGVITGIASVPLGLLILTDSRQTYLLSGTDKHNYNLAALDKSAGCLSYKSVQNISNSAIWLGYEGIMVSVGSAVQNISKTKVDISDIGTIHNSFSYDSIYYLCGSNYTLTIDFKYSTPSFKKLTFAEVTSMTVATGKIYYIDAYKNEYIDLYKQGELATMEYKSPMFIGAAYDLAKEFTKINLVYNGTFTYKVFVDKTEVLSKSITSSKISVEEISLPSENREGLSLELEIIGTGSVYSFKYLFAYLNNN